MAIRYDSVADRLQLAVGDLLWKERSSDPRIPGDLRERSALGREVHIQHAENRAAELEGYQGEVGLEWAGDIDGAEVLLRARVDGIWRDKDGTVLEEVKSTLAPLGSLPYPSHMMQGRIYLWMASQLRMPSPRGLLTYVHPFRSTNLEYDLGLEGGLEDEIQARLLAILTWHRAEAERLARRSRAAASIRWPFADRRPGQEEMDLAVRRAISSRRHLLLSAPTGSGKTPPLLLGAFGETASNGSRLAFATSRTAQQQERITLLQEAVPEPARGRVVVLGARSRFEGDTPPPETLPFDPWEPPGWFLEWLDRGVIVTPDETARVAARQGVDPVALQAEAARCADVLIGDMNLLASPDTAPYSWENRGGGRSTVLLIDEAHGLPDRLRDRRAARLIPGDLKRLADELSLLPSLLASELSTVVRELGERLRDLLAVDEQDDAPPYERIDPAFEELAPLLLHARSVLPGLELDLAELKDDHPMVHLLRAGMAVEQPAGYAAYLDRLEGAICWELAETGPAFQPLWERVSSVVAFSATLDPLELARDEFGLRPSLTDTLRLPDPYGPAQRLVLRCDAIDTTWQQREASAGDLAEHLLAACRATGGRWLVFLPSKAYLELVERHFDGGDVPVLALRPGMPAALFQRLADATPAGPSLHLAVLGGAIAEGVSPVPGSYDGLAVVSVGLPPPSPRAELLRVTAEERGEPGMLRAYVLPGLRRVQQAAGRLLRSPGQRGVLLLIGKRFVRPDIEALVPEPWVESDVHSDHTALAEAIAAWWSKGGA